MPYAHIPRRKTYSEGLHSRFCNRGRNATQCKCRIIGACNNLDKTPLWPLEIHNQTRKSKTTSRLCPCSLQGRGFNRGVSSSWNALRPIQSWYVFTPTPFPCRLSFTVRSALVHVSPCGSHLVVLLVSMRLLVIPHFMT